MTLLWSAPSEDTCSHAFHSLVTFLSASEWVSGRGASTHMLDSVWPGAKHLTYASQCFFLSVPGLVPGTGHRHIPLHSKTLGKLSKEDRNTSSGKLYCPDRISPTLSGKKKPTVVTYGKVSKSNLATQDSGKVTSCLFI